MLSHKQTNKFIYIVNNKFVVHYSNSILNNTDLDDCILDRDQTSHDVNNPLRVDYHPIPKKFIPKMLQSSKIVQKRDSLVDLDNQITLVYLPS